MDISVLPIEAKDLSLFKKDMQEAFQRGAEAELEHADSEILPEKDIDKSLSSEGAIAYKAVSQGSIIGGAIVVIDDKTQHNHLDFLYVKHGLQSEGVGQKLWKEIECMHPDTVVWETCTPYFEKRNIHFYVNRLGFHVVEFFNPHHKEPNKTEELDEDEYFFRFEKRMK